MLRKHANYQRATQRSLIRKFHIAPVFRFNTNIQLEIEVFRTSSRKYVAISCTLGRCELVWYRFKYTSFFPVSRTSLISSVSILREQNNISDILGNKTRLAFRSSSQVYRLNCFATYFHIALLADIFISPPRTAQLVLS